MRELRSYRDPYTGHKRTSAWEGPYRAPLSERIASVLLAVILGLGGAILLFYGLSS